MKHLKNLRILSFAMLFLVALTASSLCLQFQYNIAKNSNTEKRNDYIDKELSEVDYATKEAIFFKTKNLIQTSEVSYQKAIIDFKFPLNEALSKNQMILTHAIFSLFCFLIATKFHIETSIYEFFHKDEIGAVVFEGASAEIIHNLTIFIGMIFKCAGFIYGIFSLFIFVF
jgi:hypothetical protein